MTPFFNQNRNRMQKYIEKAKKTLWAICEKDYPFGFLPLIAGPFISGYCLDSIGLFA